MTSNFSYKHFHPYSIWTVDENSPRFYNGKKAFIIDSYTGDKYFNEDLSVIRRKCFLLALGTPIVHTMGAIVNIVYNLLKLISLYDFWKPLDDENQENYDLTMRLLDAGVNVFNIVFAPIAVLLLEFSALYGMIMPYDGRKLYASLERFTYGDFVLAPCFQPEPKEHLLGGDIRQQNAF